MFWEGVNPCFRQPERTPLHHFPLCTGCTIRAHEIVAFTPGHIFDRLFLIRQGGRLFLSNSLPFVLRAAGARLHPQDLLYHWRFGITRAHRQSAPLERGKVEFFQNINIVIGRDHQVRCEAKPLSPDFDSFADYKEKLDSFLEEISAAMRDECNIRYEPVSTISAGYDSPAAAVLAKSIGATRALTISDSRYGEVDDDSGEAIAERLGLSASARSRDEYRLFGFEAERLFYLYGQPEDIVFYSFRGELRRTLLFTGYRGDLMWDINARPIGTLGFDPGGATLQCFRLRSDFVHFPIAFFGWARHSKVIAISRSEEMKPWSLGSSYDRPIPRRFVEEAGVPRHLFGVKKRAVAVMYGVDKWHYVGPRELSVSAEFAELLRRHAERWRSSGVDLAMAAGNGLHALMRRTNAAMGQNERKRSRPGGTTLRSKLAETMSLMGNPHRAFWIPFTDLCFAAQAVNELLALDYPSVEQLAGGRRHDEEILPARRPSLAEAMPL
ncbi:MAG: hypothetical protein ACREH4_09875 [Vitreimonas sp.]